MALPVVRMLHTSDIHIWDSERSVRVLESVVRVANEDGVDITLIAGDLFDSARVGEVAVKATLEELGHLSGPAVVIPGNHDCVDERSIYHRVNLSDAGDHIFFVGNPDGEELMFEHLGLKVWARGIENHDPTHHPLAGYQGADSSYWNVVLTHGHYVPLGEDSDRSSQIQQDEIAQLGCHYLALGHWHHFVDVSEPGVKAFYSGSPSGGGPGAPTVNLVTLDPETGVQVERRPLDQEA